MAPAGPVAPVGMFVGVIVIDGVAAELATVAFSTYGEA